MKIYSKSTGKLIADVLSNHSTIEETLLAAGYEKYNGDAPDAPDYVYSDGTEVWLKECVNEVEFNEEYKDQLLYDKFEEAANGRDIVDDGTMEELRAVYEYAGEDMSKIDFKEFADQMASSAENPSGFIIMEK